jgi:hypothetical protein
MGAFAVFGISNDGLNLAVKLLLLFILAIWAALVFWTYADARRRIEDPMLVGCAAAASLLFPFVGTIVYVIVRPPEYMEDARERELEILAAQARLHQAEQLACPYCDFEIEKSFLRCPSCLRRLKEPCGTCGRPLDPRWKICPYCEAEVGAAPAQARRRPRRTTPAGGAAPPERQSAPRASASSARSQDPGGQTVEHPAPTRPQSR